jgi:hypothetical protein
MQFSLSLSLSLSFLFFFTIENNAKNRKTQRQKHCVLEPFYVKDMRSSSIECALEPTSTDSENRNQKEKFPKTNLKILKKLHK